MSLKMKALHNVALMAGVQFVYTCKFHSSDLTRKSVGQTLWSTLDVNEALRRWRTIGEKDDNHPAGKGYFHFIVEASIGQAGEVPKKPNDDQLDFFPINSGIPTELSAKAADRPTDAVASGGPRFVGRGRNEAP